MQTDRRSWLKTIGMISAGLCLPGTEIFAAALSPGPEKENNTGPIRLCFNENPYGPPPSALEAMKMHIGRSNRYPWELITSLMSAVAAKNKLTNDHVTVGAGSTQIIDMVIQLAAAQKGNFILAKPTFGRWAAAAEQAGLQKTELPLTSEKRHDLSAMHAAIRPDTRLIYICNPNNPTGTICAYNELVSFIQEATKHSLVLVDEAYLDYTNELSLGSLVSGNENLIVVKTLSKIYGLAGARIGYALAHPKTTERLQGLQSGANLGISAASLAGAIAALSDTGFVQQSSALNSDCRSFTTEALERQHIKCIPSHTNFMYFSLTNYKQDFFEKLKTANILGTGIFEEEGKWTRISIGTRNEMQQFIDAVKLQ